MTIHQINELLEKKSKELKSLQHQFHALNKEISELRDTLYHQEMIEFVNYLQLDEVLTFDNYYNLRGVSTSPKANGTFHSGEKIKIVKKNKKSIVVEVVKKHQRMWDDAQKKSVIVGETNPGWKIRVELDSFFHFYLKNPINKSAFYSYIKRKQALENLISE